MTILQAAYRVAKCVKQLPFRRSVADLMNKINFPSVEVSSTGNNYGNLGQQGRNAGIQFVGYLAAHKRFKEAWRTGHGNQPEGLLTGDELELLLQAHSLIQDINDQLLAEASQRAPLLPSIIDPYHENKRWQNHYISSNCKLEGEPILKLREAFEQHPAWKVGWTFAEELEIIDKKDANKIRSDLENIKQLIYAAGCANSPPDIEIFNRVAKAAPEGYSPDRLLVAMLTLKFSLMNLNQLLYQAFQFDKLPLLDEDCVYRFSSGSHAVGHYAEVVATPTKSTFHLSPGDLVLVNVLVGEGGIDGLYCVGLTRYSFSQDTGYACEYHLRRVDENLNCLEGLID